MTYRGLLWAVSRQLGDRWASETQRYRRENRSGGPIYEAVARLIQQTLLHPESKTAKPAARARACDIAQGASARHIRSPALQLARTPNCDFAS